MSEQVTEQNEMSMSQENAALRSKVTVLEEELALANQQLEWFRKQVFGRKTERTSVVLDKEFGVQISKFGNSEEKSVPKETVTVPEHKRKKKRTHDDWMSKLPVVEVFHKEEHPVCENCGAEMEEFDDEKSYDELVYTPAKFHVRGIS